MRNRIFLCSSFLFRLHSFSHRTLFASVMENKFVYSSNDFNLSTVAPHGSLQASNEQHRTRFEKMILGGWDRAMQNGVFRYSLHEMRSRVVDGEEKFILQLNLKRGIERRKPESIFSLKQAFDPQKFNFTKVKTEEILCELCPREEDDGSIGERKRSKHLVLVNVSPLEYGHILLVPDVDSAIPQKLTYTAVKLALDMLMLTENPGFRVGFNSLCALASVNHQHLHAWYLQEELKIESAEVLEVGSGLYQMVAMPTRALAFQLHGCSPEVLARRVYLAANHLQQKNIAHNLYMTRGRVFGDTATESSTVRVFLWPRKPVIGQENALGAVAMPVAVTQLAGQVIFHGAKNEHLSDVVFNVAVSELAGQVPMYAAELFDSLSEDYIIERLEEQMLPLDEFKRIAADVAEILQKDS